MMKIGVAPLEWATTASDLVQSTEEITGVSFSNKA